MNKVHNLYTKKNYNNRNKNNVYSFFRNWLYFTHNLERAVVKMFQNNVIDINNITSILDVGWWEWSNLYFLKRLFNNSHKAIVVDYSEARLIEAKKMFSWIEAISSDMRMLNIEDNNFDLVTFFVSLMFMTTEEDINKALKEANRVLKKGGYLMVYEKKVKQWHFNKNLSKNWFEWYSFNELDRYLIKNGFEQVWKEIYLNKTIFWKYLWYLTEYLGYNTTYFLDVFLPWWKWNFICLYKKI